MVGRSCRAVARTASYHALAFGWVGLCALGTLVYWFVSGGSMG